MRASTLLASVAVVAAGCEATVDVERFCITQQAIEIPGSLLGLDITSPYFSLDLTDQLPLLQTNSTDTDLRVDEVTITAVTGNPDLSGVTLVRLRAQPASGSGAAVSLAQYQRAPTDPASTALVLSGDDVNIMPYLDSGQANLQLTLSGRPPRSSWSADVKTCLHGQGTVSP
ncbi:MAG: hypothetical protein A2V77_24725 [Anaeromyxobacter sp. RBG_16_69_14]|nr:MAG: hypothetical protein A2V77_24725 [Anaeromyxobacter sp. RBG_16_69_14]HJW76621.1 hypothetical protein [Thermoleophilia bacterium]